MVKTEAAHKRLKLLLELEVIQCLHTRGLPLWLRAVKHTAWRSVATLPRVIMCITEHSAKRQRQPIQSTDHLRSCPDRLTEGETSVSARAPWPEHPLKTIWARAWKSARGENRMNKTHAHCSIIHNTDNEPCSTHSKVIWTGQLAPLRTNANSAVALTTTSSNRTRGSVKDRKWLLSLIDQ